MCVGGGGVKPQNPIGTSALVITLLPVHPPPIRDHPKDTGPTWDLYMLQATSHTATDIGETEGPHTLTATSWCSLPNPLWFMFQSVHWPNGQDAGAPPEGAQKGTDVREHSPVSSGRTCS